MSLRLRDDEYRHFEIQKRIAPSGPYSPARVKIRAVLHMTEERVEEIKEEMEDEEVEWAINTVIEHLLFESDVTATFFGNHTMTAVEEELAELEQKAREAIDEYWMDKAVDDYIEEKRGEQ